MSRLFNWIFRKKESVNLEIENKPNINIGDKFVFCENFKNPFDSGYPPVTILDVKDGWVLYNMSSFYPRCSKELEAFLKMYKKVEVDKND